MFFGHIHFTGGNQSFGKEEDGLGKTLFINAACCGEKDILTRDPTIIEINSQN